MGKAKDYLNGLDIYFKYTTEKVALEGLIASHKCQRSTIARDTQMFMHLSSHHHFLFWIYKRIWNLTWKEVTKNDAKTI
jgi:hypothetical protein